VAVAAMAAGVPAVAPTAAVARVVELRVAAMEAVATAVGAMAREGAVKAAE